MKLIVSFVLFFVLLLVAAPFVSAADSDIVINEFQVDPSGSEQWVELYNKGSDEISITDWVIDDNGGSESYTIPSNVLNSHQCISFQSGAFNLNTATSDTVQLLKNGIIIDSHAYDKSPGVNSSFGRAPDGEGTWISYLVPTRDGLNADGTSCVGPSPTPTPTNTPTPSKTPTPTKVPTATKAPTPTKTPTPIKSPTPASSRRSPTPNKNSDDEEVLSAHTTGGASPSASHGPIPTTVLGATTGNQAKPTSPVTSTPTVKVMGISQNNLSFILIGGGIILLGGGGYFLYRNYKKDFL